MPELPEVETIRNDLKKAILKKKITAVIVRDEKIVKNKTADFIKTLRGRYFAGIDRIGKLLIFKISGQDNFLLVHLKMTGQLVYSRKNRIIAGGHENTRAKSKKIAGGGETFPNKYTRIIFEFENGAKLFFNDLRKFGYAKIVKAKKLEEIKNEYGIEPLTEYFTYQAFKKTFKGRKAPIKAILLDQRLIAGIGNIYADEALFLAGIRPDRLVINLEESEKKSVFQAINSVIKQAIKHRGTTFNSYIDVSGRKGGFFNSLKVYGREGKKCLFCSKTVIKKIKVAGRGTRVCEKCQK